MSSLSTAEQLPNSPAENAKADIDRRYKYWRIRVMYSMMGGYAFFYFVRKNMSMATKSITDEFGFTNTEWGLVLSASTIVYALSKFASGILADRVNPRYMMSLGLILSALVNLVFGLGESLLFFGIFWSLNNLFQGSGMPPCSRLLTTWFSSREIGRAWGVWNASHQIGGALIVVIAAYLVAHFGWRSAFWIPGLFTLFASFWLFNRLTGSPEDMGLPPVEIYKNDGPLADTLRKDESFIDTFRTHILWNKWVWIVSIANFFVYIVRIGILDWAPKYLEEAKAFNLKEAGYALSGFEIAGIFGAYASGWLSDKVFKGRRGPVSVAFMLLLILAVLVLFIVPDGQMALMSLIFIAMGFLVYGPQMLIAVAAADFASKKAASSAVGLTGLFGYLGATLCGVGTGLLVDSYGWNAALAFYVGSAVIGALLLLSTWHQGKSK